MEAKMKITFYRPMDRTPGQHLYGTEFDNELNNQIGGISNWSFPPDSNLGNPKATFSSNKIEVELHENGPEFTFLIEYASQITGYISALTGLAALWISVRTARRNSQTKEEEEWNQCETYTTIEHKGFKFTSPRDLSGKELQDIVGKIVKFTKNK